MLFKDYSLERFIGELSSEMSSPGGGSTAALVAALASSLNSMVYSLTIDKKSFEKLTYEEKEDMIRLNNETQNFTDKAQDFMEKDREDFMNLMDSYKLPKETEEEIEVRKVTIKGKTFKAMETPFKLAEMCLEFYDNIEFAIEHGNKNLVSDAGVAAVLLHSAIESAIINVKVNLNSLRDEEGAERLENDLKELVHKSEERKNLLLSKVNDIIYPSK